jgi:hypothetical protein
MKLIICLLLLMYVSCKVVSENRDQEIAMGIKERFDVTVQSEKRTLSTEELRAYHWSAYASIKRLIGEKEANKLLTAPTDNADETPNIIEGGTDGQ